MSERRPAAVCKRGHVASFDTTSLERVPPRCGTCGAGVLDKCPTCSAPIPGRIVSNVIGGTLWNEGAYNLPNFCNECGVAYPWADREARIFELGNLLEAENLDDATQRAVREQLEALTSDDLDTEEQTQRWERVKKLAPTMWEKSGAQQIITTLVIAEARVRLGLPPK
jgi:hypothetical protein